MGGDGPAVIPHEVAAAGAVRRGEVGAPSRRKGQRNLLQVVRRRVKDVAEAFVLSS